MFKIAVAGTGYVGLVAGVCFAEKGNYVSCVDVDQTKIKQMEKGISPIYEQDLEPLMQKNHKEGRLCYTTDYSNAYKNADFIFIGVGTPEREDGSANLSYVFKVAKQIAECVEKDCIVVIKSTVPIGTNDEVEEVIKKHLINKVRIDIVSNPEFLAQGTAVRDTLQASRIVIGAESEESKKKMLELYENFNIPIVVTNRRSAEMIKYASNDFLALKISYMNDIANLCEIVGADVTKVAEGMSYDDRIGNKFLNAGIGYGGSCFPKDTKALHYLASQGGYELKTVKAAIEVNKAQKVALIKKARKRFSSFEDITIAVLGLTFKPGTDDLREAPSLDNIPILLEEGAKIKAYDPVGVDNFKTLYPSEINYVSTPIEALVDADICFIFTEWEEIRKLKAVDFLTHMKEPRVYDGRNIFALEDMEDIEYESIGR
jgi:nucleotide sugar dehydrogenase